MAEDAQDIDKERGLLFSRFIEGTRQAVRDVGVDRGLTLRQFMYEMTSRPLGKKPDGHRWCERCVYLGRLTPTDCRNDPGRVIRMCSPVMDPAHCRFTLCFDGDELDDLLRATEPSEDGSIPSTPGGRGRKPRSGAAEAHGGRHYGEGRGRATRWRLCGRPALAD